MRGSKKSNAEVSSTYSHSVHYTNSMRIPSRYFGMQFLEYNAYPASLENSVTRVRDFIVAFYML
jgi:hypothetical protein